MNEPGSYSIRYRFSTSKQDGSALLKLNGREYTEELSKGDSEVTFKDVRLNKGAFDLAPMISAGGQLYSPWKIDIVK